MKVIFVMPSGIEFIKEVGIKPPLDYRVAIPKEMKPLSDVDFKDEVYLLEKGSVHLVFELNINKFRYEYKYIA